MKSPIILHITRDLMIGRQPGTLYKGAGALSTRPVMLIWAPLIPATMWRCSRQLVVTAAPPSSWNNVCPDKLRIG